MSKTGLYLVLCGFLYNDATTNYDTTLSLIKNGDSSQKLATWAVAANYGSGIFLGGNINAALYLTATDRVSLYCVSSANSFSLVGTATGPSIFSITNLF